MKIVKCTERTSIKGQLEVGCYYWMDETTKHKDTDGDEYAMIYYDKIKAHKIGYLLCGHFEYAILDDFFPDNF